MSIPRRSYRHRRRAYIIRRLWLSGIFLFGIILLAAPKTNAATLSSAQLAVSDPRPAATSGYTFTGSSATLSPIKCIKLVYADTASGSNVPSSMVTTGATFDTANTNYIPTPAAWTFTKTVNGTMTLTNAAGETPAAAAARKIAITGITNSTVADTKFFLRVNTYNNTDCSSAPVDNATVLFILTNGSTLTLTVDQTLSFTVNAVAAGQTCNGATSTQPSTATTIPFGTVTTAANSVVCQDLQAATNATSGYTLSTRYTSAPTNALAQTIASTSGTNTAPAAFPAAGTEAYGYTTNDATLGTGTPGRFIANNWAAMTAANAEVGYEAGGVTSTTYRVGHQVGISPLTRPGTYQTTVIYTCTPVY